VNVLVTGGTGLLGRSLVHRLVRAGHRVRVLTRSASHPSVLDGVEVCVGDLERPASLHPAVEGVGVVVHCASDPRSAETVDVAGTSNLLAALRGSDVSHLVHVSIVGVDRFPIAYYRAKHATEMMVADQSVPWTIQRATQFHPFVADMVSRWARMPVIACPAGLRFQPIAVDEVAQRLVQHVTCGAAGKAADLGGPEILAVRELASTWLSSAGRHRLLMPLPFPGAMGRAFKDGANLCAEQPPPALTWGQHLDEVRGVRVGG